MDNPRQQDNVARAARLGDNDRAALEDLLRSMQAEEDRLMSERTARIAAAQTKSTIAFVVAALLTGVFTAAGIAVLRAQRGAVARQHDLLHAVLESVDEGIIAASASRGIVAMNAVARAMVGRTFPRDHLPDDWREHIRTVREDGAEIAPKDAPLARALRGEPSEDVVYQIVPADGVAPGVWVSTTARPIRDRGGIVVAAVATLRDVTEERARTARLHDLSLKDELTGLLNRRGFLTLASGWVPNLQATKAPLGLLYADLNGLKKINDGLGHEHGDRAIRDAAVVLQGIFRGEDVLARMGGDEFVALLPNFLPSAGNLLLERLASAVRSYRERVPRPYRLSISAGVTFMKWDSGQTLEDLLAEADRLMYARKRAPGQSAPEMPAVSVSGKNPL